MQEIPRSQGTADERTLGPEDRYFRLIFMMAPEHAAGFHTRADEGSPATLTHIYLGTPDHGPCLGYLPRRGWFNVFSHGNYGGEFRHGGTWSSRYKQSYPTIRQALANRQKDRDMLGRLLINSMEAKRPRWRPASDAELLAVFDAILDLRMPE